jgi:hypothetical protein
MGHLGLLFIVERQLVSRFFANDFCTSFPRSKTHGPFDALKGGHIRLHQGQENQVVNQVVRAADGLALKSPDCQAHRTDRRCEFGLLKSWNNQPINAHEQ